MQKKSNRANGFRETLYIYSLVHQLSDRYIDKLVLLLIWINVNAFKSDSNHGFYIIIICMNNSFAMLNTNSFCFKTTNVIQVKT